MVHFMSRRLPLNFDKWLSKSIWWNPRPKIIDVFITEVHVRLHKKGVRKFRNIWSRSENRFLTANEMAHQYYLSQEARLAWDVACNEWYDFFHHLINRSPSRQVCAKEWFGVFASSLTSLSSIVY